MMAGKIAGQKRTCGFRARPEPVCRNREEAEALRVGFHDFERRNGRHITRRRNGSTLPPTRRTKRRRRSPESWHGAFVLALERTGEVKSAAASAGVAFGTARSSMCRNVLLRAECDAALSAYALRRLREVARGLVERWECGRRAARLLLAIVGK